MGTLRTLEEESAEARSALDRAFDEGDVEEIVTVIHVRLWLLYDRHHAALQRVVAELPGDVLVAYPLLRVLHPMASVIAGSSAPLDAESVARIDAPTEAGKDAAAAMRIIASRMSGDVRASARHARELSTRIYETHVPSRAQRGSVLWFLHYELGSALLLAGDTAGAVREISTAREIGRLSGSADAERACLGRLALAEVLRGSVEDAEISLRAARALEPLTGAYAAAGEAAETIAEALIGLEREVRPEGTDWIDLATVDSTAFIWPFVVLAKARYLLLSGRPSEALETARAAAAAHRIQDGTLPADILARIYVDSFLALGHTAAAAKAAQAVHERGALVEMALARLDLVVGDLRSAGDRLQSLASVQSISPVNERELTCLLAWECAARGSVTPDIVRRFAALLTNPDARRIVLSTPRWVVDTMRGLVSDDLASTFEPAVAGLRFPETGKPVQRLTASERRVLAALAEHERVADLASALMLSPNTVKTHLSSLYRKLGVSSRREAIESRSRVAGEFAAHDVPRRVVSERLAATG